MLCMASIEEKVEELHKQTLDYLGGVKRRNLHGLFA